MQLTHVLLKIKVATKAFTTGRTRKRLSCIVRVHVKRKIVNLMKCLIAYATAILLLIAVRKTMILPVALLMKALATEVALPWLLTTVYAHVRVQR